MTGQNETWGLEGEVAGRSSRSNGETQWTAGNAEPSTSHAGGPGSGHAATVACSLDRCSSIAPASRKRRPRKRKRSFLQPAPLSAQTKQGDDHMDNDELQKWNDGIEEVRGFKVDAMKRAMKARGWRRSVHRWFARLFGRIEAMGQRWRDAELHDNENGNSR